MNHAEKIATESMALAERLGHALEQCDLPDSMKAGQLVGAALILLKDAGVPLPVANRAILSALAAAYDAPILEQLMGEELTDERSEERS